VKSPPTKPIRYTRNNPNPALSGIRHRYIRPRRPQQNGKVERSHRIDQEEFWGRHRFPDFEAAAGPLRVWETTYNFTASPWPFRAALPPKNWPRSARHCAQRRHLVSTRARYLDSGVNLDETQHATL